MTPANQARVITQPLPSLVIAAAISLSETPPPSAATAGNIFARMSPAAIARNMTSFGPQVRTERCAFSVLATGRLPGNGVRAVSICDIVTPPDSVLGNLRRAFGPLNETLAGAGGSRNGTSGSLDFTACLFQPE